MLSVSVAAGIGSPMFVFAAVFSATLRVREESVNEGALFAVPVTRIFRLLVASAPQVLVPLLYERKPFAMLQPAAAPESSSSEFVAPRFPVVLPTFRMTTKYEVFAASMVFDGAAKKTFPVPTTDGTVRDARLLSGSPEPVEDHNSARRFAGVPTAVLISTSMPVRM